MNKFLNLPIYIWIAQGIYVIVALVVLLMLLRTFGSSTKFNARQFAIGYVVIMIVINVVWRVIAAKLIR